MKLNLFSDLSVIFSTFDLLPFWVIYLLVAMRGLCQGWAVLGGQAMYIFQTNQIEASRNNQSNCRLQRSECTNTCWRQLNMLRQDGGDTSVISRCFTQDYDHVASYTDALWARHAIFLAHERLLKQQGYLLSPITGNLTRSRQRTLDPEKFCERLQQNPAWPFNECVDIKKLSI